MPFVRVSKEAAEELSEAAAWYERESPGLGSRLIDAFEHALTLLRNESPPLVPVQGEAATKGAERLLLQRFPFSVIVVRRGQELIVVALAHFSRRPGYWRDRLSTQ